jgi:hypothetical protein
LGVPVEPDLLTAPGIDSIAVPSENPCEWLDRTGRPVPLDVDLYMVDTSLGVTPTDQTIRALEGEGYVRLPDGHGFRWRGRHMPDCEIVMLRSPERRIAWQQARRAAERAMNKRTRAHTAVRGSPAPVWSEVTETVRPLHIPQSEW